MKTLGEHKERCHKKYERETRVSPLQNVQNKEFGLISTNFGQIFILHFTMETVLRFLLQLYFLIS